MCKLLSQVIRDMEHCVTCSHTLSGGVREAVTGKYDVVLLDVGLPDGNGLDAISWIQKIEPAPLIIIITGSGDRNCAELAIRSGAWDYIQKPGSIHGFAVVADEVRNLAMRAADAAKNTTNLIEGALKQIKGGSEIAEKTRVEFLQVTANSSKMSELVGEIAAASNEQAQGSSRSTRL